MRMLRTFLIALLCLSCLACQAVKPWQKGYIAKDHMEFDPAPLDSRFMQHVYQSKEGSSGGYGINAGGCGCN